MAKASGLKPFVPYRSKLSFSGNPMIKIKPQRLYTTSHSTIILHNTTTQHHHTTPPHNTTTQHHHTTPPHTTTTQHSLNNNN
jgi:hypothetical protein